MSILKRMKKAFPFQEGGEAEVEVGSYRRALRRDYRRINGTIEEDLRCVIHSSDNDEPLQGGTIAGHLLLEEMLIEAAVFDGDEFEILVTRTGVRPHGDRLWIRDGFVHRPETDDECLKRIEEQYDRPKV